MYLTKLPSYSDFTMDGVATKSYHGAFRGAFVYVLNICEYDVSNTYIMYTCTLCILVSLSLSLSLSLSIVNMII